jgi:hypothetical protein
MPRGPDACPVCGGRHSIFACPVAPTRSASAAAVEVPQSGAALAPAVPTAERSWNKGAAGAAAPSASSVPLPLVAPLDLGAAGAASSPVPTVTTAGTWAQTAGPYGHATTATTQTFVSWGPAAAPVAGLPLPAGRSPPPPPPRDYRHGWHLAQGPFQCPAPPPAGAPPVALAGAVPQPSSGPAAAVYEQEPEETPGSSSAAAFASPPAGFAGSPQDPYRSGYWSAAEWADWRASRRSAADIRRARDADPTGATWSRRGSSARPTSVRAGGTRRVPTAPARQDIGGFGLGCIEEQRALAVWVRFAVRLVDVEARRAGAGHRFLQVGATFDHLRALPGAGAPSGACAACERVLATVLVSLPGIGPQGVCDVCFELEEARRAVAEVGPSRAAQRALALALRPLVIYTRNNAAE